MPGPGSPQIFDRLTYITPDGVEYMLSSPTFVLQEDGLAMPPIEWITQRGPAQHGETLKGFFLRPRIIQMVVRREGCSRDDYWRLRGQLMDMLRPNRTTNPTPGILRKYTSLGQIREYDVYATEGPGFPSHDPDHWDQWAIHDTLRFTAYDPAARDPTVHALSFVSGGVVGSFPITFPWQIASFGSSAPVTYNGTWLSYPTIIINGPMTSPLIRNLTTNELIQLNYAVGSGRTVTIDLRYGFKSITLDDGTNLIGFASSDSDLGTFHLQPGPNTFQIFGTGTSAVSSVQLSWFERFIGV